MPVASLLGELSAFLDAQSTALTFASNLFAGHMPETTGRAMAIFETAGGPPAHMLGGGAAAFERPDVQLIARSTRPVAGAPASATGVRTLIDVGFRVLEGIANEALSGTTYLRVSALQSPYLLEVDSRGRQVWSQSFAVARRRPADRAVLQDSDGVFWLLSVSTDGALVTSAKIGGACT